MLAALGFRLLLALNLTTAKSALGMGMVIVALITFLEELL